MGLDIRLPIGLMFSLLGPLLVATGLVNGTFLNVQSGGAMTLFGAMMLGLGLKAQKRARELTRAQEQVRERSTR